MAAGAAGFAAAGAAGLAAVGLAAGLAAAAGVALTGIPASAGAALSGILPPRTPTSTVKHCKARCISSVNHWHLACKHEVSAPCLQRSRRASDLGVYKSLRVGQQDRSCGRGTIFLRCRSARYIEKCMDPMRYTENQGYSVNHLALPLNFPCSHHGALSPSGRV